MSKKQQKRYLKIKKLLSASAKTCDDLEVVFDAFVAENDMLTENLMKSLIAVESTVCNLYERLHVFAVASRDKVFSYSDETTKKPALKNRETFGRHKPHRKRIRRKGDEVFGIAYRRSVFRRLWTI